MAISHIILKQFCCSDKLEMLRRGYTDEEVKKVAGLNLLRAMEQMEKVAHEAWKD